jgi:hypothetical protein
MDGQNQGRQSRLPYFQRLLEDEYVQEQLRGAAAGLRDAYDRAARQRAQATEDKKLYGSLRHAATSIRNAAGALKRAPEPPPKHRARNMLIVALAVGATVLMAKLAQKQKGRPLIQRRSVQRRRRGGSHASCAGR